MKVKTAVLSLIIMMFGLSLYGMESTTLIYRETTKHVHEDIPYTLSVHGESMQIEGDFNDEYQIILTDKDMNTKELTITYSKKQGSIAIQREHDRFIIEGESTKSIHVDPDIPWYQFLINLRDFVMSGDRRKSFYVLSANFDERISRGKGIRVLQLVAKRDGYEVLSINGEEVHTVHVAITFDDIRSLFWKAHYWFRESDGTLVRYREVRGGPGTPETMGTLIEEEHRYE